MTRAMSRLSNKMQQQQQQQGAAGFAGQAADQGVALGHTMVHMAVGGVVQAVAVQSTRDLVEVQERVQQEAELSAESLMYRWTTKNKDGSRGEVKGLSIEAAMMLARNYGNCCAWADIVAEDQTHWTFQGYFLDRETGFISMRLYRHRKYDGARGRMDPERLQDIEFQIGQSKAVRNATLRGIPEGLKQLAEQTATQSTAKKLTRGGKAKGIEAVKRAFAKYDVKIGHLESRVGKKSKEWIDEDLAVLRQIYQSIVDGETSAENEFDLSGDKKQAVDDAFGGGSATEAAPEPAQQEGGGEDQQGLDV